MSRINADVRPCRRFHRVRSVFFLHSPASRHDLLDSRLRGSWKQYVRIPILLRLRVNTVVAICYDSSSIVYILRLRMYIHVYVLKRVVKLFTMDRSLPFVFASLKEVAEFWL